MATFRTQRGKPVAYAYEYQITHSDHPDIKIGNLLYDHGRELVRQWNFFDRVTREVLTITGKRSRRICSICAAEHGAFAPHGHAGLHSPDVERLAFPHPSVAEKEADR